MPKAGSSGDDGREVEAAMAGGTVTNDTVTIAKVHVEA
jgi:hypothetical protein